MKLPTHIIQSVKWFEHSFGYDMSRVFLSPRDRFVLHFKQWWKPRKVMWFDAVTVQRPNMPAGTLMSVSSHDALELLAQLKAQCKDQA
jgi:hypothetical protein